MKPIVYIIQTPPTWVKTPPLSLAYLKTYLQNKNIDVRIIDLNLAVYQLMNTPMSQWLKLNTIWENELFSNLQKTYPYFFKNLFNLLENADYIGFSISKRNAAFAFNLINKIKNQYPDKKIILGGPQTLILQQQNKLNSLDYWVIGEGEIPLEKIINGAKEKVFSFEEINNLDSIPFLDFLPLNFKSYSPTIPLLSSRGCFYKCNFCSEKLLYKNFRNHCPQYIFDQIKFLQNKHQINDFVFCDSLINYNNQWLEKFCRLLIENNLKINWQAQMRVDKNISIDLANLIKRSGCYNLFIGLENGSPNILKSMQKGFAIDDALTFFKILNKAKLQFEISLILGYPNEQESDFNNTINFIRNNKKIIPKIAQVNPFVDYLASYPKIEFPTNKALQEVNVLVNMLKKEKIKYTKGFINNLIYW